MSFDVAWNHCIKLDNDHSDYYNLPTTTGLGILFAGTIGILYFKEPITALKIVSIILIALGVIGLNHSEVVG